MPASCIGHLALLKESLELFEMLQAGSVQALLSKETKDIPTSFQFSCAHVETHISFSINATAEF